MSTSTAYSHTGREQEEDPSSLREEMLNILHQGDEGIVKYRDNARQVSLVARPFSLHKFGTVPYAQNTEQYGRNPCCSSSTWETVAACGDTHIHLGQELVVVDYYRYNEVTGLLVASANKVILALKNIFGQHGVPELLMSDNGPHYSGSYLVRKDGLLTRNHMHLLATQPTSDADTQDETDSGDADKTAGDPDNTYITNSDRHSRSSKGLDL